ncbi:MAG: hypothetical protein GC160_26980 [Acidobacteria bacterium]|nr:hypothetical protein [Acidobacteriota bacterium]
MAPGRHRSAASICFLSLGLTTLFGQADRATFLLVQASAQADGQGVESALGSGASVNAYVGLDTPLTAAVRGSGRGRFETPAEEYAARARIVAMLLERGADPKARFGLPAALEPELHRGMAEGLALWTSHSCAKCHDLDSEARNDPEKPGPGLRGIAARGTLPSETLTSYEAIHAALSRPDHRGLGFGAEGDLQTERRLAIWLLRRDSFLVGRSSVEIAQHRCMPEVLKAFNQPFAPPEPLPEAPEKYLATQDILFGLRQGLCQAQSQGLEAAGEGFRAVSELTRQWDVHRGRSVPREYALDLDYGRRTLPRLSSLSYGPAQLSDILADLREKAADCSVTPSGMGREVPIEVSVFEDGRALDGWQVFFISKMRSYDPNAEPEPFGSLSSPARSQLPVGRYLIHAVDEATRRRTGASVVTVGRGQDRVVWELPAR